MTTRLFACLAAFGFAACSSSDDGPDTTGTTDTTGPSDTTSSETSVTDSASSEVEVASEVEIASEVEVADEVEVVSEVASETEVTPSCVDLSGGWTWTGSCSGGVTLDPHECIRQTGCAVDAFGPTGVTHGTVEGDTATVAVAVEGGQSGTCTYVVTGNTATVHCVTEGTPAVECNATGARTTVAEASSYCCDVVAQDCGAGERCTLVSDDAISMKTSACVPEGHLESGVACARRDGRIGADDCGRGLFCANIDQPRFDLRACAPLCGDGTDCPDGGCYWIGDAPIGGVCMKHCDPFGNDCADHTSCVALPGLAPVDAAGVYLRQDTACVPYGAKVEGDTCADRAECGPHLDCRIRTIGVQQVSQCRSICDAAHPCAQGMTCLSPSVPVMQEPHPIGACWPD